MRFLVCLLALSFLAVPVAGHGGEHVCDSKNPETGWTHLRVWAVELAASESNERLLAWDGGCPLQETWWILVWVETDGPLNLTVNHEGNALADVQAPSGVSVHHFQLPASGFPELHLSNDASEPVVARMYFDQTCECPAKTAPVSGGPLWFNGETEAGQSLTHDFQFVPVQLGLHNGAAPTNFWVNTTWVNPGDDFAVLRADSVHFNTTDESCGADGALFRGCWQYTVTPRNAGMQYILMTMEHDGDGWGVGVRPEITRGKEAPGLGVGLMLLGLVVAARRR